MSLVLNQDYLSVPRQLEDGPQDGSTLRIAQEPLQRLLNFVIDDPDDALGDSDRSANDAATTAAEATLSSVTVRTMDAHDPRASTQLFMSFTTKLL